MLRLREAIIKLYKKAATSLPSDVEAALKSVYAKEEKQKVKAILSAILEDIRTARKTERPICQDTGVPVFFIKVPAGISLVYLKNTIINATRIATKKNSIKAKSGCGTSKKNSRDKTST